MYEHQKKNTIKKWGHRACLRVSRLLSWGIFTGLALKIRITFLQNWVFATWNTKNFILDIKLLLFKWAVLLHLDRFWLPGCGEAWSPRLDPNTQKTELFSKKTKSCRTIKLFSSSNMFFIRLFLANSWKKIGFTVLVSSQTAVKDGHGLEIAVRMDKLRGGDWGEIQNSAHRFRSMHSRSSLFLVIFMCLILPTKKFKLEKSTINTKEWGKSRFAEIWELWMFILAYFVAPVFSLIPVSAIMLDKETWRKDYWFLFFICSLVWFLYTSKCEFSSKLRVYIKDWSPSCGSGVTVGLICSTNIRLSILGV